MFEMILVLLLWACFTPVKLRNIQAYFSACLVWSNTANITIHCLIFPGRIFKVCYWVSASYMVSSLYYVIGPNMVRTLTWDALCLTSICFLEGRWVISFYCHAFTLVNKVDLIWFDFSPPLVSIHVPISGNKNVQGSLQSRVFRSHWWRLESTSYGSYGGTLPFSFSFFNFNLWFSISNSALFFAQGFELWHRKEGM